MILRKISGKDIGLMNNLNLISSKKNNNPNNHNHVLDHLQQAHSKRNQALIYHNFQPLTKTNHVFINNKTPQPTTTISNQKENIVNQ